MVEPGFVQDFHTCTAADTITSIRVDIGEMRADMRHLTERMAAYMSRTEAIQHDHESRLRSVEAVSQTVQNVSRIEKRLATVERALAEASGRDRFIGYLKDIVLGGLGAAVGLFGGGMI